MTEQKKEIKYEIGRISVEAKEKRQQMHNTQVKGIVSSKNGMNLYRGCTHGCIYCDSRSHCYQFTYDFEDVSVKQNAIELLEKALHNKKRSV